ncbi:MAG TPA: helix-turn-helix transcriptional regulator [Nocardioides sp.]|nr:helix-turn-helix transcriptional regulator [Nocardioides sp.]
MGEVVQLPVRREQQPSDQPSEQPSEQVDQPRREVPGREPRRETGAPVERSVEPPVEPLWRESVGRALREQRLASGKRLVDVAEEAGVSPQYLSEVERGLKDPSSELLAAIAGALGLSVAEIATRVASTNPSAPTAPATPSTRAPQRGPQSPVCLAA